MIMLNPVQTKFGAISIETLMNPREEEDRIKIYDSDDRYLDYFPLETLIDGACEMETTVEEEYTTRLGAFREADDIEELIGLLTTDAEKVSENPQELIEGSDSTNYIQYHYINRIGKYYILMRE